MQPRSRRRTTALLASALALGASLFTGASPARAQGFALERFIPAPAGDRFFGAESPFAAGHLTPHGMILVDYAHNPLMLRTENSGTTLGAIIAHQFYIHANISFSLWNRLNINLDVPAALVQKGDSPSGGGFVFTSPNKAQFSDLRAGLRVRIVGDYFDAFQLAIGGFVWFPTGASDSFVSDRTVRGLPEIIIGGRTDRVVWSFSAGAEIRKGQQIANIDQGIAVQTAGGLGILLSDARRVQIGPEFRVATVVKNATKRSINAEVLLGLRVRPIGDLELALGAGPGLSAGLGTPDFRGVFSIAYTPEQKRPVADRDKDGILDADDACPDEPGVSSNDPKKHGCPLPKDRDGDGIFDPEDACPDVKGVVSAEPAKHGCPPPNDRDGDRIVDEVDACPDEPGLANDDPKKHGCPLPKDRDGDGIIDEKDACPDVKGVSTNDPTTHGCPPDTDGDGIRDDKDACPLEKGPKNEDPAKNGCPTSVRVVENEIIILQQVQFDTGKATIKKVSDSLLDEVAGVLKEHPEILKIEVQGHTDNKGIPLQNKILSNNRAQAVMKALVKRGIAAGRLSAKGFGQDQPIDDNSTDEGRQKNRRVQFKIVQKIKK